MTGFRGFLLVVLSLQISSCLMGGGSDQPNRVEPRISGRIIGGDDIPLSAARVRIYSGSYHSGFDIGVEPSDATLDTEAITDSKGDFRLRASLGRHFLEAASSDSAWIGVKDSLPVGGENAPLGSLRLSEGASLTGIIASKVPVAAMILAGTHFKAIPDSLHHFRFPLLPPGQFRLVALLGSAVSGQRISAGTVTLESGQALQLDTIAVEPGLISMFDFDGADPFSGLRGLTYPYDQPADSRVGAWSPLPLTLDTAGAYRKKSLHTTLAKGASMGFAMGNGYYDLSKLSALSFRAKGTGKIQIRFHCQLIDPPNSSLRMNFTLTPDWSEIRATPANIKVPVGSNSDSLGYTWEKAKSAIAKITFFAPDSTVEVWMDEVRLEGLDYKDLGTALPAGADAFP